MAQIVRDYWAGAVRRLQAEVDEMARLISHMGARGSENEAALTRLLQSLIPERFGVGTGLLIDAHDRQSNQTDVVIYEQAMEATLFAQTTQLLFPVESVYACVEVKTTLSKEDLEIYSKQSAKLGLLQPSRQAAVDRAETPLKVVFAYSAWAKPSTILAMLSTMKVEDRPDLLLVVRSGFLYARGALVPGVQNDAFCGGVTALLAVGEDGVPDLVEPETNKQKQIVDGQAYPYLALGQERMLVDPARGMLLFLEILLRELHRRASIAEPVLSLYLDQMARHLVEVKGLTVPDQVN